MDTGQILKRIKSVFNSHQKHRYPNSFESMFVRPARCPTADQVKRRTSQEEFLGLDGKSIVGYDDSIKKKTSAIKYIHHRSNKVNIISHIQITQDYELYFFQIILRRPQRIVVKALMIQYHITWQAVLFNTLHNKQNIGKGILDWWGKIRSNKYDQCSYEHWALHYSIKTLESGKIALYK